MRNATILPLTGEDSLVIATDNSGAIGEKESDEVQAPYETIAYYAFRVAVMECMAAGGKPFAVIVHNFCGDESWNDLVSGVKKGLSELELSDVNVTGSTESNFSFVQSAVGMIVLGKRNSNSQNLSFSTDSKLAILGNPLVGEEVLTENDQIIPLSIMKSIFKLENTSVWLVGSKGIQYELNRFLGDRRTATIKSDVELSKPAGPSTCVIVSFPPDEEQKLRRLAGELYHPLTINLEESS